MSTVEFSLFRSITRTRLQQVKHSAKEIPALSLSDPLTKLRGVGESVAEKFKRLRVSTIGELLELLPFRFEDYTRLSPIKQLPYGELRTIRGRVKSVHTRRSKKGVLIIQASLEDESGSINALWFNQRFILKELRVDTTVMLWGEKRPVSAMGMPFFVKKIIPATTVAPIYPSTAQLYQSTIKRLIEKALIELESIPDLVPANYRERYGLPTRQAALTHAHLAPSDQSLAVAKRLLGFEELLVLALQIQLARRQRQIIKASPIIIDEETLKAIASSFPFRLTNSQRKVAWQIIQDMTKPVPMNRLLYGEVGSGKTAVAILVAAAVIASGRRVAWLNPTTLLASQQASSIRQIVSPLGFVVALVTGNSKEQVADAKIIIGTHALLNSSVELNDIGLVIIDEQHRFGVEQRQQLLGRHPEANVLMMTATPIPRTLAQTVFGHLDVSYLTEKPANRQPVETIVFEENKRQEIVELITNKINAGEPGYVICPLIVGSTSNDLTLFKDERKTIANQESWLKECLPQARIAVIHGRVAPDKRDQILQAFKSGEYDILLSTTVVEVGIDNPQATWILIEEADRFGLSTLHQLRGRIGRGAKSATCYLAFNSTSELAQKRLELFAHTTDGLEIAQIDLELRGPGELIGMEQSGLPPLKFGSLADLELVTQTSKVAEEIITTGLEGYPRLLEAINKKPTNEESRG